MQTFLLTRPLRDVTRIGQPPVAIPGISTHTPLAGRDLFLLNFFIHSIISTHTPLAGRDTLEVLESVLHGLFLLTRPLRDVTYSKKANADAQAISTHTPLAGRDGNLSILVNSITHFYSHAPCGT